MKVRGGKGGMDGGGGAGGDGWVYREAWRRGKWQGFRVMTMVWLVRFHTWKVFLFKSYAGGQQTAHSDAKWYTEDVVRRANRDT